MLPALPQTPRKLPRRDWLLLPLVSLLTIASMFTLAEMTTRVVWTQGGPDPCRLPDNAIGNAPNCRAWLKRPEGPWEDYSFNDCGYRSEQPCRPKHPSSFRIALLGSSLAGGYMVPYAETFAARTGAELTRVSPGPVEFQNMGALGCWPGCAARRVGEALSINPDAVMLAISPYDVSQITTGRAPVEPSPSRTWASVTDLPVIQKSLGLLSDTRTVLVAKHFLYQNTQTYLGLYLLQGDTADFLRQPFTPAWEARFTKLDLQLAKMAEKTRAAGIPLILVVAPEHAQTILLNMPDLPAGVDPYAFQKWIAVIAARHGIVLLDVLKDFRDAAPQVNSLFYPADGHWTALSHSLITRAIVRSCLEGTFPISPCAANDPPGPPADRTN